MPSTGAVPKKIEDAAPKGPVTEIGAGEFKALCLQLMDDVAAHHMEIVITKRGRPVAKLVPYDDKPADIFGYLAGSVQYHDDIVAPTGEQWDADS